MVTETNTANAFSLSSFPQYNQGGLSSSAPSGATFQQVLATVSANSTVPEAEAVQEQSPLVPEVKEPHAIPQDPAQFNKAELLKFNAEAKTAGPTREELEEQCRQAKAKHAVCPFVGENGECCRPDIRCGERAQFSGRESERQQKMPHRCLYMPFFASDNVIVIEKSPMQREFILNSFKLFLNYDTEKFAILDSAEEASQTLTQYKLQNRLIGLVIVNCSEEIAGVEEFLTEIYERNINADVILTGTNRMADFQRMEKFLELEKTKGVPFISYYLQTPIHTEKLVETITSLHFGRFL